jgi:DNA-binding CsgD family transcriptional regulator
MKEPGATKRRSAKSQLARVLDAVHRLYAVKDVAEFPKTMMAVAEELVPCVNISFDSVNLATGEATDVFDRPIAIPHHEFLARWQSFCHEHPGIAFLKNGGKASVFAIDDFLSQRQFRRTAFYQEFFHPISGTHQLGVILPLRGFVAGMAMNRDAKFTSGERELIELLHPHFVQALHHAQIFSSVRGVSEFDYRPWRTMGLTHRECEVLRWLMEGKRNDEIAVIVGAKPRTVGKHLENIYSKLGVETRAAAAAEARRIARQFVQASDPLRQTLTS